MLYLLDFAENEEDVLRNTQQAWDEFASRLHVGDHVEGQVAARKDYGVFVDFGELFPALIEVTNFTATRYPIDHENLPGIGSPIQCQIIQIVPHRRAVRAIETPPPPSSPSEPSTT